MIPYADNVARRLNQASAVLVLVIINATAFIYELIQIVGGRADFFNYALSSQSHFYTIVTYQFLHGGWIHLIGNMLYLWVFGRTVEDYFGSFRFLLLFLICGALGGLAQIKFFDVSSPIIGASASIAGVMGAYSIWFSRAQIKAIVPIFIVWTTLTLPVIVTLGLWFATNLFNGYASILANNSSSVAYISHIVGFLCGLIFAFFCPLKVKPVYIN